MNILLTGGTGFVGSHFCDENSIKRIVVRGGDCKSWACEKYNIEGLNGHTCWSGAFEDIDTVIHLAALAHAKTFTKDDYQKVNVDGALHLAEQAAMSGVKRFVFISSIGVNGSNSCDKPFNIFSPIIIENEYTHSKLSAEQGLKQIGKETGLEVIIVRPTLVYGANAPGNFGMLTKLVRKLYILPFGLVNNRRNFIAVQNLVDLIMTCAAHPNASGHTFLASDSETVSIKEFTNEIAQGFGKKVIQVPIPVSLMRFIGRLIGKSTMIEQLIGNLEVDSSNIKDVLGWTPPFTMEQAMTTLHDSGVNKK